MAQRVKNPPAMRETQEMQIRSLGWEDPLEEGRQPTPVFLPGKSHDQRILVGYSPWGSKKSDTTERTHKHTHICTQSQRIYQAHRRYRNTDPEAPENIRTVNMTFIEQTIPDIRRKLQNSDGAFGMNTSQLVDVAFNMFNSREQ